MRELIVKLFYMLRFAGRKFELWDFSSINTELLACYFLEYVFSLCVRLGVRRVPCRQKLALSGAGVTKLDEPQGWNEGQWFCQPAGLAGVFCQAFGYVKLERRWT